VLFMGEHLGLNALFALALILGGLAVSQRKAS
jgi:hypothetical protein